MDTGRVDGGQVPKHLVPHAALQFWLRVAGIGRHWFRQQVAGSPYWTALASRMRDSTLALGRCQSVASGGQRGLPDGKHLDLRADVRSENLLDCGAPRRQVGNRREKSNDARLIGGPVELGCQLFQIHVRGLRGRAGREAAGEQTGHYLRDQRHHADDCGTDPEDRDAGAGAPLAGAAGTR